MMDEEEDEVGDANREINRSRDKNKSLKIPYVSPLQNSKKEAKSNSK